MSLSPDQLAQRLQGMTATDIAAIVGCHPHRVPLDVWLEKTGQAQPFAGNLRTRWGDILEGPIRRDYEERHRVRVEVHGTLTHPQHSWWMSTPDGLVYPTGSPMPDRGLEIKVHGRDAVVFGGLEYGPAGSDEVPIHELIQCSWGMGCTGLPRWDLIAFLDGAPNEYTIERDDDLIGMLAEQAERFLVDHVRAGVPPQPDGSKAWDEWQKRKWKKNTDDLISIDDDPSMLALIAELRAARDAEVDAEEAKGKITQRIKEAIGERAGFTFREDGRRQPSKVTWKRSADGSTDDWNETVSAMRSHAAMFASARAEEAAHLADLLRAHGGDLETSLGSVASARICELIDDSFQVLREIAEKKSVRKTIPGARPFNVPRHWKKARTSSEKDSNNHEEN